MTQRVADCALPACEKKKNLLSHAESERREKESHAMPWQHAPVLNAHRPDVDDLAQRDAYCSDELPVCCCCS